MIQLKKYLENINQQLKHGYLNQARKIYGEAAGPVQKDLRTIYGLSIVEIKHKETMMKWAVSRAKYPVILDDKTIADFELQVRKVTHNSQAISWPKHLQQVAKLALSNSDLKLENIELSFFPPVKIGNWYSIDIGGDDSKYRDLTIQLKEQSDSYSAALYVAIRHLLTLRSPLITIDFPYVTGCYKDEEELLVPPSQESLRQKYQSLDSSLLVPILDESPHDFYRRLLNQDSRTLSEIFHELQQHTKLKIKRRQSLFKDALRMIEQGKEKTYFSKVLCLEIYSQFMTLASHIDQLNEIKEPVYLNIEKQLQSDSELYSKYVCIRLNKMLYQSTPEEALSLCQSLMHDNLGDLPIIPEEPNDHQLKDYPNGHAYIWNTLSQIMLLWGRSQEALKLVRLAIRRNQLSDNISRVDLIRYQCRYGQLLTLIGQTTKAIEVLKKAEILIDDEEVLYDRSIESSKKFLYLYLSRAFALNGSASEASNYLRQSEAQLGGSIELEYTQFEIMFLLSIYEFKDYANTADKWGQYKAKYYETKEQYKYVSDRVERIKQLAEQVCIKGISLSNMELQAEFSSLHLRQLEAFKRCAAF